jgi:molybdopterin molybdotransferase
MQALSSKLTALISQSDAIITSGGAWKGDRDLIAKVLDQLGWKKMFHRIRMGPGKAVGFGTLQGKPIFCLPGGPPSNEMAFLLIAFPAVYQMAGYSHPPYIRVTGILESKVQGKATWTQFIHCMILESGKTFLIRPLRLESRLASMAGAQGILKIHEGVSEIEAGREIRITLLDNSVIKSRE